MTERKLLRRLRGFGVFLIGIVLAFAASVLVPYFLAGWISGIPTLVVSAIIAVVVIGWGSAWAAARIWRLVLRTRFILIATGVLTALFIGALYIAVLRPTPEVPVTGASASTKYWLLPTGSQIAYSEYDPAPGIDIKPEPILFLHGGPGMAISPFEKTFFQQFAADGYRVYLFDQAGGGLSGFLPPRQYTVSRFVEDIEAIRKQVGADKIVLIGHSWGATLAASYIAQYPEHVAKVVFYSPGPIWNWTGNADTSRAAQAPFKSSVLPPPRLFAALLLAESRDNPVAGEQLVSQREAESLYLPWIAPQAFLQVCRGETRDIPPYMLSIRSHPEFNPGFNPFVFDRLTDLLINAQLDPHPRLRGNGTPAIVIFSECDFLPWASSLDYRKTFENSKVYYVRRAGHIIELSQPDLLARIIRAFLLDQDDPIPPYRGDADPRLISR